jgi:asparagine synthase (glutamine-hydrolysing)
MRRVREALMKDELTIRGWVEEEGRILTGDEIETILSDQPDRACGFGGEFSITYGTYRLRDHLGVVPGDSLAGLFQKNDGTMCSIAPNPPLMPLEDAVKTAVLLRSSDKSVVALSGGVDSSFIAAIAGRPCICVGIEDSHDLARAQMVAETIHCDFTPVIIDPEEVEDALRRVIPLLPSPNPVDASIAATAYFLCRAAAGMGYDRIISGQGADELFCGYTRYLESSDLERDRRSDITDLPRQMARDQAVAGIFGIWLSLPFLDARVMRAADQIPVGEMIQSGVRKFPLRKAASAVIPEDIAWYDKKAMQYGSGVWKVIRDLARERGFKKAVQGYICQLQDGRAEHGF